MLYTEAELSEESENNENRILMSKSV